MSIFICQFCGRETTNVGASKAHENRCKQNPNPKPISEKWLSAMNNRKGKGTNQYTKAKKLGLPIPEGTMKGKLGTFTGKKHSEETKKKISNSRKRFIEENPHMSPWVHSHYTKRRSYAERYWKKILDKHKISFEEQHQFSKYCLDFAILDRKINLEIDGEQHYNETRVIEKDKSRDEYMIGNGWKIIRIRWKEYKKLNKEERKEFVSNLINKIKVL